MSVTWRGVRVDRRTAEMLDEVARLTPNLPRLSPSQGSYNTSVGASAGTHAGGGAVDIRASNLTAAQTVEAVRVMRIVGFAAWRRLPSEGDWPEHIHGIAVGQPDLSPAAARQVDALRAGRNGLANNGPDRHANLGLPVITFEQYRGGDAIMALPRKGDRGEHVEIVQRLLVRAGFDTIPKGSSNTDARYDGHYGDWTQDAVEASRAAFSSNVDPKIERVTPWHYARLIEAVGGRGGGSNVNPAAIEAAATKKALTAAGAALTKAAG